MCSRDMNASHLLFSALEDNKERPHVLTAAERNDYLYHFWIPVR